MSDDRVADAMRDVAQRVEENAALEAPRSHGDLANDLLELRGDDTDYNQGLMQGIGIVVARGQRTLDEAAEVAKHLRELADS